MSSFFSANNPAMRFLTSICNLILANLCFVVCCIPIITIGASISSLYRITMRIAAGDNPSVFREFFSSFKENFVKSTLFELFYSALTAFFLYEIYIVDHVLDKQYWWSKIPAIFFLVIIFCSMCYSFPLTAWFEETWKQILKNSLLLAITNFPTTIFFGVITAGIAAAFYFYPVITFSLMIFMGTSTITLLFSLFLKRIFEKHGAVIDYRKTIED